MKLSALSLVFVFGMLESIDRQSQVYLDIKFFDSMRSIVGNEVSRLTSVEWQVAAHLYDQFMIRDRRYLDTPRIPKIIHQIWAGSPLPEKYKALQKTWIDKHPDWKYRLWTDKEVDAFGLMNRAIYDASPNYGVKSDIARAEILYKFGGLYVDTDFECLAPFDVFHHCLDFYVGTGYSPEFMVFNGLIGCAPGHPIMEECIKTYSFNKHSSGNKALDILNTTGPFHFTKAFVKHAFAQNNTSRIVAFPVSYFYPWPWYKRDQKTRAEIEQWIRPETFAIHHWHVSWNNGIEPGKTPANQPKQKTEL